MKLAANGDVPCGDHHHPPLFLGSYPLSAGVQAICGCHFLACLFVVATASSVVTLEVWDLKLSPRFQIVLSAWHIIGISVAASAFVATLWQQALPLRVYFYYLVAATCSWLAVVVLFFQEGATCALVTVDHESQRVGLSMTCGLVSTCWELWSITVLVGAAYACYSVWHLAEFFAERELAHDLFEFGDPLAKMRPGALMPAEETPQW